MSTGYINPDERNYTIGWLREGGQKKGTRKKLEHGESRYRYR
jgi:hypothetical protein